MADLDTRSKRSSSVGFWKPYVMTLPLPDNAISQGDRQQAVWDYSGITFSTTGADRPIFRAMWRGMFRKMNLPY